MRKKIIRAVTSDKSLGFLQGIMKGFSKKYEMVALSSEGEWQQRLEESDVNGLREVTQGYGILFPHEDVQALAAVIRRLHDDKEYYQEVAQKCYERALQFDISNTVEGYNNIYKQVVSDLTDTHGSFSC